MRSLLGVPFEKNVVRIIARTPPALSWSNVATTNTVGQRDVRRELMAHLKLRFVAVETGGRLRNRTIIFLQDVTEIENQAQQLKLASMGRLTASIAHEVRNPLSAIAHAASLLREDVTQADRKCACLISSATTWSGLTA